MEVTAVGRFFYESLTLNSAGTFFTDRKSGGSRCAEVTVIRGSTVLHIRRNNKVNEPSKVVLGKLLDLEKFLEKSLPKINVSFFNSITQPDNGKASFERNENKPAFKEFAIVFYRE